MSLRTRLWLVLGGLFLLPVVVGGFALLVLVPDARSERVTDTVGAAGAAVAAEVSDDCRLLGVAARSAALEAAATDPQQAAQVVVEGGYADYAALLAPDGSVVVAAGRLAPGAGPVGELSSCTADGGGAESALAESADAVGVTGIARAVAARNLDAGFLQDLRARSASGVEVVLLDGDRVVTSTTDAETARTVAEAVAGSRGTVDVAGWTVDIEPPREGVPYTVAVAAEDPGLDDRAMLLVLIVIAGVVAAGLLVRVVAKGLSQPFTELSEAAERVVKGDLDTEIATSGDEGEAARIGSAFNQMVDELRRSLRELERSREDLRDSLERIGDALSSTHDLEGLLQVVLETATATLGSRAGVVLYLSGDQLALVGEQGLHEAGLSAPSLVVPGTGVLGRVVSTGTPVRGRIGSGPARLEPTENEPTGRDVLAVPLRSMGSVVGVVALYDRVDGRPFEAADEDALGTLAGQASIAIDNVQLHQEAQRLSTTDGLTGLWNFRYLSMSLAREIERSTRFARPLAVLMLDLDHFKSVNDTYGHARGDTVLRELAHRVQEQIREVDTFARYGGEEFVVVLPETTVEGAAQLAERICVAVRREPFVVEGEEPLHVTVSVGGAAFPEHGSSPATLMRAADKALYVAKAEGRDRWHVPGA
jgi:diguanylate cyclase (GGDEF)-like protein